VKDHVGKNIDLMLEELWSQPTRIRGELVGVEEDGWLIRAESIEVPAAMRALTQYEGKRIYYVPTRLIMLASVAEE